MAPPKRPWFRCYVEIIHDRKIRTRTPSTRWLLIALFSMARSSPEPGVLLIAEGMPADEIVIADEASLTVKETRDGLSYYETIGVISRNEIGAYVVTAFLERQFESDLSTDRTTKHRSIDVALDGDETAMERSPSVSVDNKKAVADMFERFYDPYPLKKARRDAERAFASALKRTDIETIVAGVAAYKADLKRSGVSPAYPATWLNDDRWLDEPTPTIQRIGSAPEPMARIPAPKTNPCPSCAGEGLIIDDDGTALKCQPCAGSGRAA